MPPLGALCLLAKSKRGRSTINLILKPRWKVGKSRAPDSRGIASLVLRTQTAALGPERVDCPSLALGALCFWLVMVAARDGSGATRLSSEMESPALESGAPDKSRSEGETALMRLVRKYNWVRYLHVPLFGQMRGCQSAELRLHHCVSQVTGYRPRQRRPPRAVARIGMAR